MGLRVLVLEDHAALRRGIERHLRRRGAETFATESIAAANSALDSGPPFDVLILDLWLPEGRGLEVLERLPPASRPVTIVMTGEGTLESAVGALRVGAIDYLLKPFSMDALDAALARVTRGSAERRATPVPVSESALADWRRRHAPTLLGSHPSLLRTLEILRRVAPTDCSILVCGETGTGKELVARAIHSASGRSAFPFVALNCAAVPEQLMESELFGHGRGAFTGAQTSRAGRFVAADRGTLFLDEVGEMPLPVQAKLLRALQEKEILPLGENNAVEVDVRIVAATHRDLERMVEQKRFREDLLYRLDVIRVGLAPLRERRDDIPAMIEAFLADANRRRSAGITGIDPAAMSVLLAYDWPGNGRQLLNAVERMVVLRGEGTLELDDIPEKVRAPAPRAQPTDPLLGEPLLPDEGLDLRDAVERFEGSLIQQALDRAGGNKNRAAAILRVNRTTLVEKIKRRAVDDDSAGSLDDDGRETSSLPTGSRKT